MSAKDAAGVRARRSVALAVAALLLLGLGAVVIFAVRATAPNPAAELRTVRGVLLSVQSSNPVQADQVTLRDDEGRVWTFQVSPEVAANPEEPQSAGHLRQHMALVEPVVVRYREGSDGLVALRILDGQ